MWLESVGTVGDGFAQIAHGICIVSENAFGVGVTAVPSPLTDIGWDGWIWHQLTPGLFGLSVTESENVGALSMIRYDIDSKAMRKQKSTDFLIGVSEFAGEIGAATLQFITETRILDKLP